MTLANDILRQIASLTSADVKDRHQWWGHDFRCSLTLDMDKLLPKAMIYILYH